MGETDKWAIVYYNDEIGIRPSHCKQPENCECDVPPKCYYTTAEALIVFRKHYKMMYNKLMKMNEAQFLRYLGHKETNETRTDNFIKFDPE